MSLYIDKIGTNFGNVQSSIPICKIDFLVHYLTSISTNKFALKPRISFIAPSNKRPLLFHEFFLLFFIPGMSNEEKRPQAVCRQSYE